MEVPRGSLGLVGVKPRGSHIDSRVPSAAIRRRTPGPSPSIMTFVDELLDDIGHVERLPSLDGWILGEGLEMSLH